MFDAVSLLPTIPLPIYTEEVWGERREEKQICLSREQAEKLAHAALLERIVRELADAEVLGYDFTAGEFTEDACTVSVSVRCVENIAKEVPLDLTQIESDQKQK